MAIITAKDISLSFGSVPVLEKVNLQVEKGERVCLVGRNGEGKSTLMKVLSGEVTPDSGELIRQQNSRISRLTQEVPDDITGTVFEVISTGLGPIVSLLSEYHRISALLTHSHDEPLINSLEDVHHALEAAGGWQTNQKVETVITRLKLPADAAFKELSGGYKRRVLLAKALVAEPDLLLLDEPTNHLDIESVNWLEEFLLSYRGTLLFVTHDRMLLRKLATRIVELDRGRLTSWPGNYDTYLERKDAMLEAEKAEQARFDKRLAEEEIWIRQGIKARRTRNEGRVSALKEMRKIRSERRESAGSVRLELQDSELSGKLVIEAKKASYGYNDDSVIKDFSTIIMRGDKVGIIGPNGAGKTTLLKLLLGQVKPISGTVRLGTKLEVSYFDQHRAELDGEKTVQDNIAGGNDQVIINGKPRHIIGYLQDFLFPPQRSRTPVKVLSGGERNRLLLAKLFTRPSNVLVMDEPTNDLDTDTLELLEELILDYPGTVLVVSHDRAFLNNIATSTIVFENGGINEYVGGYDDWMRQRKNGADSKQEKKEPKEAKKPQREKVKLSYKEERELEALPGKIETLEAEQATLYGKLADPAFYQKGGAEVTTANERLKAIETELEAAYRRWEELEGMR